MIEKHLMKLRARDCVTADEEAVLRSLVAERREVRSKATVIHAGELQSHSTLLLEGLMCRYKDLSSGQRQVTQLHVPGDFVDLHSFTLKRLDHHVMALTPCAIATVPHERLAALTEHHPHLTRLYWFSTNVDAAIHREWELSLGRRTAASRMAHLFCELFVRFELVGMTNGCSFPFPLTQIDLAECVGLTSVHVNRTLKELREQGVVDFSRGQVTIQDLKRLKDIAEFDSGYLYLTGGETRPV